MIDQKPCSLRCGLQGRACFRRARTAKNKARRLQDDATALACARSRAPSGASGRLPLADAILKEKATTVENVVAVLMARTWKNDTDMVRIERDELLALLYR